MSREIKFRAWDKTNKVMVENVNINQGKAVKPGYQWFQEGNTVHNSPLMQFTGLFDKEGKEIYEGDVMRWKFNHYVRDNVVFWSLDQSAFRGKLVNDHGEFDGEEDRTHIIDGLQNVTVTDSFTEVIGNIYEHPELAEPPK